DWKGIPRRFPLSESERSARNKLGDLLKKNDAEFDFDAEKRQREEEAKWQEEAKRKGFTLGEFAAHYFKVLAPSFGKRDETLEREKRLWHQLEDYFGAMPLCESGKLSATSGYRVRREKEVSFVTANRELAFVRYLLNRAMEDGLIDAVPRIRL